MEIAFAVMLGIIVCDGLGYREIRLHRLVSWGKVLEQPTIEKQQKMLDEYYKYECEQEITARGGF